jgi:hypothetical protein
MVEVLAQCLNGILRNTVFLAKVKVHGFRPDRCRDAGPGVSLLDEDRDDNFRGNTPGPSHPEEPGIVQFLFLNLSRSRLSDQIPVLEGGPKGSSGGGGDLPEAGSHRFER